jgi:hypothetical protein
MKTLSAKAKISGFTPIELLVVVVVILIVAILTLFLLSTMKPPPRPYMVTCLNNQKQIAVGFIMWRDDNDGKFPWEISSANNGTMESSEKGDVAPNYSALLAYVHQPRIFVCPTDTARTVATNQARVLNQNASYFVGLDNTNTNPAAGILTGDRHLKASHMPVGPGLFVYSNGLPMNWTLELHGNDRNSPMGVISFQDGHVTAVHGTNTDFVFQNEGLATSRFAVP